MAPRYRLQRSINHNSSPVTSGRRMFVDPLADGRSAWARRWNDLVVTHASDLGGYDMLSEAQISLCKRVATLECELESMEGRKSAGLPVDIELYARIASRLCRLLELIGRSIRSASLPRPLKATRPRSSTMTVTAAMTSRFRSRKASTKASPARRKLATSLESWRRIPLVKW